MAADSRVGAADRGGVPVAAGPGEPIAIVGIGCRFPGGVSGPHELWSLVAAGAEAISPSPTDRGWARDRPRADPDGGRPPHVRRGDFLAGVAEFDAEFFGVSAREAHRMDPGHRLLLETSWEALERAGLDPTALRGSRAGIYAGEGRPVRSPAAGVADHAAARLARYYGSAGPVVPVDTAGSSSLVALHLAVRGLRAGECSVALVCGAAVMAAPGPSGEPDPGDERAPDGRCPAFADGSAGTSWGEGVGVLVLERLAAARRRDHPVLAVVRGTATGSAAPGTPAQSDVIRRALADAGLHPGDLDAVEAHGPGTRQGDRDEAAALLATFDAGRSTPLWVGSLTSDIGHIGAAAGIAGTITMVQAVRHGVLPRTLHVDRPTTQVDWSAGSVRPLTEQREWATDGRPRRAGISSFGTSGTGAHVVIEEAGPDPRPAVAPRRPPPAVPWLLSARSAQAVRDQAALLLRVAEDGAGPHPLDIGYSLATGRAVLQHRAVAIGAGGDPPLDALHSHVAGRRHPALVAGTAAGGGRLAVLFSGQGSQRPGMGRELRAAHPVFADAFDEVCAHLDPLLGRSVLDVVLDGGDLVHRTVYAQASLFAFEVALFRLVSSWGVRPDVLMGHSIGEVVAAHVAGVLTLPDAATLVAVRGRLMQALSRGGAMVAVEATEAEAERTLVEGVAIAAVNTPTSIVLSGDEDRVLIIAGEWEARGRRVERLSVSHAFHSPHMDGMLAEFRSLVAGLSYTPPRIAVVSNATGLIATSMGSAGYWVDHIRSTVRFHQGVRCLEYEGVHRYLELGPDRVLTPMVAQSISTGVPVAALDRRRPEPEALVAALAALHVDGLDLDWSALFADRGARWVELPTYPFQRRRIGPPGPLRCPTDHR